MANKRISTLDDIQTTAGNSVAGIVGLDVIPVTDVSDTTGSDDGTTKKVTVADLLSGYQAEPAEGAFVDGDKTKLDSALQSLSAGALSDFDFDDNAVFGFKASLPTEITAATYSVADADNGKVIRVNHASGCTVTIPSGLLTTDSSGFNCSFVQVGAGAITFANDGTSAINNRQSHTKTNGQWAVASVVSTSNDVFVLAGDTTA
jgi:hypothetical protein